MAKRHHLFFHSLPSHACSRGFCLSAGAVRRAPSMLAAGEHVCCSNDTPPTQDSPPTPRVAGLLSELLCASVLGYLGTAAPWAFAAAAPAARSAAETHHPTVLHQTTLHIVAGCETASRHHLLTLTSADINHDDLSAVQWWVLKCRLPLHVVGVRLTGSVCISHPSLAQLVGLTVSAHVRAIAITADQLASLQQANLSASALQSLTSQPQELSRLHTLAVHNVTDTDTAFLTQLPALASAVVCGSFHSTSLRMARWPVSLSSVELQSNGLVSAPLFADCTSVRSVTFLFCAALRDVSALAHCSSLKKVSISRCGLRDCVPLRSCRLLEHVDLSACSELCDVSPLSALPLLRKVDLSWTDVASLAPLRMCAALTELRVCRCSRLLDLSALAGAPQLCVLDARWSGVSSLEGLHRCPCLSVVHFEYCRQLADLTPLAGAPALREIYGLSTAVRTVGGLERCPVLERVDFSECEVLESLHPLARAPALRVLTCSSTPVVTLSAQGGDDSSAWSALEAVDLSGSLQLHRLPPSWCAVGLRTLDMSLSGIEDIGGLHCCPSLTTVDFAFCVQLADISALAASAEQLMCVDLKATAISTLLPLTACCCLEVVDVSDCSQLVDLSPLQHATRLRRLAAGGSGVRYVHSLETCSCLRDLSLPTDSVLSAEMRRFASRLHLRFC